MFCFKCGSNLAEGSKFCQSCGVAVNIYTADENNKGESIFEDENNFNNSSNAEYSSETVLLRKGGGRIIGALGASGGFIKLTNQRLIHESLGGKIKAEIYLDDIVSYRSSWNVLFFVWIIPFLIPVYIDSAFCVLTKQGVTYKFNVTKKNRECFFKLFKQFMPYAEHNNDESKSESKSSTWRGINPSNKKGSSQRKYVIGIYIFVISFFIIMTPLTSFLDNKIDYIETVKKMKPYEEEGISETYEDVMYKYISNLEWDKTTSSKELIYIHGSGIIESYDYYGSSEDVSVTFKLTPYAGKPNGMWIIEPYSIEIKDDIYYGERAELFLEDLFYANYSEFDNLYDYYIYCNSSPIEDYDLPYSSITYENAAEILYIWLDNHPFALDVGITPSYEKILYDEEYFGFQLYEDLPDRISNIVNIYVNKNTSEMLCEDLFGEIKPLDEWYYSTYGNFGY